MKIIFASALSLLIFVNVCSAISLQQQNKYAVAGIDDSEAADRFFLDLQKAVEKNERDKVILMVAYPLYVRIKGRRTKLRNKAELLKNYNAVFNEKVKQAIAKSSAPSFANYQGVMLGDGEIWFNLLKNRFKVTAINN